MSWNQQVVKGGEQKIMQPRVMVYAGAGVGKSTFGSKLPKPVFIDYDHGVDDVNVDRIPGPKTWAESMALIRAVAADPMGYKSLVLDTVDPLEEQAIEHILHQTGKKSLADFDFGAGYNAVAQEWKLLLAELDVARKNGMLVCLLGHAIIRQAQDPQLGAYDQFTSQLGKKSWALTQRWADTVLFAAFDSALVNKKDEQRVIVTGDRFLFTTRGSGFEAKNRFSLDPKLPLSWPAVAEGIAKHRQSSDAVKAKILKLAAGTSFESKAKGYLEAAGDDLSALLELETNLTAAINAPSPPQVVPATQTGNFPPGYPETVPTATTAPAATAPAQMPPATEPPRQSPEAIELRIFQLAKGTPYEERAKENVTNAGKDLKLLLQVEEALTAKLAEVKNGAQAQAGA
jgi:hypothetical protein